MVSTWDGSGARLTRSSAGVLPETPKTAFTGPPADSPTRETTLSRLAGDAGRGGHRPVDGRRLGRPGVQHGVLRLGVLAAAQHVVAHGHTGDPLTDLVHHAGGVVAQVADTDLGLAAGHGAGEGLPVDRVHAGRPYCDPDLPRAGVWRRSVGPLEDLGTSVRREQQRSHWTVLSR